jgi:polysaccharide pyruvyl transferase WcaK-like protein
LLANWAFTRADAICPDLAFGLLDSFATEDRGVPGRTVAVSPIAWSDPGAWPSADAEANRLYRARMTELFEKLADRGFTVELFATARPDFRTANELRAALLARRPELESRLVPCIFLDSPSGARALFETAQVTVASRLHGLLLAAMAGQPVIALSYDRKVDELMREIEQMERRADIATFDAERICAWVEDAVRRRTELRSRIGDLLAGANRTVSMQLRQIAAEVV